MTSTFFGFNIARRGMSANKAALDVTAHNIANSSTQGYSRQQAVFSATAPFMSASANRPGGAGQIGTGVTISEIRRVRDSFLDFQLRPQMSKLGYWDERYQALSQVEMIVMEPGDTGLSTVFERFWGAWQDLSISPTSGAARAGVVETANTLANSLNSLAAQAETLLGDLNVKTRMSVNDVNSISKQIAALNKQIVTNVGAGLNPNDLMDKRDALLDDLAAVIEFTPLIQPNGTVDVAIGGRHLVQESKVTELSVEMQGRHAVPVWSDGKELSLNGGRLSGIDSAKRWVDTDFYGKLNTLVINLAHMMNTLHAAGTPLSGATPPDGEDYVSFFIIPSNTDLRESRFIQVNPNIMNNNGLIRAATLGAGLADGTNALAIARLRHAIMPGSTTSIEGLYGSIVSNLGVESQQAERLLTNQEALTNQLVNRREEAAGVSVDEELANMVQFQHGYQAAARLLSTLDEILTTVINLGR